VPGYARYRTPVAGLYLCGAAAHPGGGVMGTPGLNADREILGRRRVRAHRRDRHRNFLPARFCAILKQA
jgi:phytoene dehydrogenase-like protein